MFPWASYTVDYSIPKWTDSAGYRSVDKKNSRENTVNFHGRWDLPEWLERLTVNALVATVLGSIAASSDTVESEGRQMKQCWIQYIKKNLHLTFTVSITPRIFAKFKEEKRIQKC